MNYDISTKEGLQNAVRWQVTHLSRIAEGGVWFVPRTCSTYTVSHKNQTLTRTGLKPDLSINKVAAAMGWTVIEERK